MIDHVLKKYQKQFKRYARSYRIQIEDSKYPLA